MDIVYGESDHTDMSDRLRANVTRFAAYKAYYAERQLALIDQMPNKTDAQREQLKRVLLNTLDFYGDAEYNTAVARCRTAKQFGRFLQPDRVALFPSLRWMPSTSADPRATHTAFYGHVWRKDDPFWNSHTPGSEWNCKCDIEETDDQPTDNSDLGAKEPPRGLEGNPATTGEVFTDKAKYIKIAGGSWEWEKECRKAPQKIDKKVVATDLNGQRLSCNIGDDKYDVIFIPDGVKHCINDMYNDINFWMKNETIRRLPECFANAVYLGRKICDTGHNTGNTQKLKEKTDYFYYYRVEMPNTSSFVLHLGHIKADYKVKGMANKLYPWSCTAYVPKNIETP